MSNARDLQLLLDFLPSLSNKKVLQIGSDEDYTRVFAEKQAELFSVKQLVDIIPETFQYFWVLNFFFKSFRILTFFRFLLHFKNKTGLDFFWLEVHRPSGRCDCDSCWKIPVGSKWWWLPLVARAFWYSYR